jgi:hypothetical protein
LNNCNYIQIENNEFIKWSDVLRAEVTLDLYSGSVLFEYWAPYRLPCLGIFVAVFRLSRLEECIPRGHYPLPPNPYLFVIKDLLFILFDVT